MIDPKTFLTHFTKDLVAAQPMNRQTITNGYIKHLEAGVREERLAVYDALLETVEDARITEPATVMEIIRTARKLEASVS